MQNDVLPIAARVIAKCGGLTKTANLLGLSPSTVHGWTRAKSDNKGTGGIIPAPHQRRLRDLVPSLTIEDFWDEEERGAA